MMRPESFLTVLIVASPGFAQVVAYEAIDLFPEEQGWFHKPVNFPAERWLEDGLLVQYAEIVSEVPPLATESDLYYYSLAPFAGTPAFFLEWIMHTDGPQEAIPSAAPSTMVAFGTSGVTYHTTISEDLVRFRRDVLLPDVWAGISPGTQHTYRLEVYTDTQYAFWIDGRLIDSGTPEGPYPTIDSEITFRGLAAIEDTHVWWDYVRFGVIPTGPDFDGDGLVDGTDLYFFQECLSTPAGSWRGCTIWADMDQDGDTDCADWALFQAAWTDPLDPPPIPQCDCPMDLNGSGMVDAADLALLLGAWGPSPGHAADFNDDGFVNAADLASLLGAWGPCSK